MRDPTEMVTFESELKEGGFDQYLRWDICSLNSLSFPLPSPKLISVSTCHKKAGIFSYSFLQTFGTEERRGLCVTLGHCINLGGKQVL